MATFSNLILTELGTALQAKVEAGETTMTFNGFLLGSGLIANAAEAATLTALKSQQMSVGISSVKRSNTDETVVKVSGYIEPDDLPESAFTLYEIGLEAEDPDHGNILYGVLFAAAGQGDNIPALGSQAYDYALNVYIAVSNSADVTIVYDGAGAATLQDLSDHEELMLDTSDDDSAREKHVSNAQGKYWQENIEAILNELDRQIINHTEAASLVAENMFISRLHTNSGTGDDVILTLPAVVDGLVARGLIEDGYYLLIQTELSSAVIAYLGDETDLDDGGVVRSNEPGSYWQIEGVNGRWVVTVATGQVCVETGHAEYVYSDGDAVLVNGELIFAVLISR
jgi:hypothetical protein